MRTFEKWLVFCLMLAMMPIESIANDTVRMTWIADGVNEVVPFRCSASGSMIKFFED